MARVRKKRATPAEEAPAETPAALGEPDSPTLPSPASGEGELETAEVAAEPDSPTLPSPANGEGELETAEVAAEPDSPTLPSPASGEGDVDTAEVAAEPDSPTLPSPAGGEGDSGDSEPAWVRSGVYEPLYASGVTRVLTIAGREVGSFLVSPIGWVITPIVILVVSFFGYLTPVIVGNQASMDSVFSLVAFLLILPIVPLTTMRVLAEERRQGTLEMLLTSPVRDWELVVGKWLGSLAFFGLMFSFTLVYVGLFLVYLPHVTVHVLGLALSIGDVDFGLLLSGYLGLLALGAAFIAIGVLCSSVTQNQIVAAFLTFGALLILYYCGTASQFLSQPYSGFFDYVGASNRYQGFSQGQIALKDAVYFLTLTFGALFLATRVLESRKWR